MPVFLHQRAYGGAFRQLLDATSSSRGDVLELAVEELFRGAGIPFLRTGAANQGAIAEKLGLTVKPAPDFVIHDPRTTTLKAILECRVASDGGTARDKASRFRSLRTEAQRLGGVPVIAVLGGIGWRSGGCPRAGGQGYRWTDLHGRNARLAAQNRPAGWPAGAGTYRRLGSTGDQ